MARNEPDRAIRCLWCGEITILNIDALTTEKAIELMKKHEQTCNLNPLVKENRILRNIIKKIIQGTCLN